MYSARQLQKGLRDGSITINPFGHRCHYDDNAAELIQAIEDAYTLYDISSSDPKEHESAARTHAGLDKADFARKGERIFLPFGFEAECGACSAKLKPWLVDEKTIGLYTVIHSALPTLAERLKEGLRFEPLPCSFSAGIKPHVASFNVPSGQLVISNFFCQIPWAPEGKKHNREFNICTPLGMRNTADFIASQGAGYFQSGNMTVYLWLHEDGKKLVFLDGCASNYQDYYDDELEDAVDDAERAKIEQKLADFEQFKQKHSQVGSVCCEMWRVMMTDAETLAAAGPVPDGKNDPEKLLLTVPAGTWQLTDFYNSDAFDGGVMATLELV